MNILDIKYVAEIAKTGSMTQAAANLFMNQPNLSKSIIALEKELGITIFRRSSKGVSLTKEGHDFLNSSRGILERFEILESSYKTEEVKHYFGISVPRASYISYAFSKFVEEISEVKNLQLEFLETNSIHTIQHVTSQKQNFGIIRYSVEFEKYFNKLFFELDLTSDILLEFDYVVVMSRDNPLASRVMLNNSDLSTMIEIIHGDSGIPSLPTGEIRKPVHCNNNKKNIYIYERGSQFDLLTNVPSTYMWVSPIPPQMLELHRLIQKPFTSKDTLYRDVLIYPSTYQITDTDRKFLKHLYRIRDLIQA